MVQISAKHSEKSILKQNFTICRLGGHGVWANGQYSHKTTLIFNFFRILFATNLAERKKSITFASILARNAVVAQW